MKNEKSGWKPVTKLRNLDMSKKVENISFKRITQ